MTSIKDIKVPVVFKLKVSPEKLEKEFLDGLAEFVGRKNTKFVQQQLAAKAKEIVMGHVAIKIDAKKKNAKK